MNWEYYIKIWDTVFKKMCALNTSSITSNNCSTISNSQSPILNNFSRILNNRSLVKLSVIAQNNLNSKTGGFYNNVYIFKRKVLFFFTIVHLSKQHTSAICCISRIIKASFDNIKVCGECGTGWVFTLSSQDQWKGTSCAICC